MSYITNEADRLEVKRMIGEIVNSMTRAEAEKDFQKQYKGELKEKFNIPVKHANRLAKILYKQNLPQETEEFEQVEELYTQVSK